MHSNMAKIAMGNEQWHLASSVKKRITYYSSLHLQIVFFLLVGEFPLLDIKKRIDLNLPYLIGFVKKELATVL